MQYETRLGPAVLQLIDPNDNAQTRYQYSLCNSAIMRRRLPSAEFGDRWRDVATGRISRRPPEWEEIDLPKWSPIIEFLDSVRLPRPWSMGGSAAFDERIPIEPPEPPALFAGDLSACHAFRDEHEDPLSFRLGFRRPGKLWEVYQFPNETVQHFAPIKMQTMRSRIETHGTSWPQMVPCPHCYDWIVWAEAGYGPGYRICRGCHRHWQAEYERDRWIMRRTRGRGWPYA